MYLLPSFITVQKVFIIEHLFLYIALKRLLVKGLGIGISVGKAKWERVHGCKAAVKISSL